MYRQGWETPKRVETVISHSLGTTEIFKRFNEGKKVTEAHWDYDILPKNLLDLKEKYKIRFGKDVIPDDRDLTDRLFKAGVEMLSTTGFFCPDLGKSLTVSEDEIYDCLDNVPRKIVMGTGKDQVTIEPRFGSARRKPVVAGGPTASSVTEELYIKTMRSYAQESSIDILFNGVLDTVNGTEYKPNTPNEFHAVMKEMKMMDIARSVCGRPGMPVIGPESGLSTGSRIAARSENFGMRATDGYDICLRNEMKIDYIYLNMLAASEISSTINHIEALPVFGGYCGGPEETAICSVACAIASYVLFGAQIHIGGPIHIRWGVTTARDTLKVLAHTAAAIDGNSGIIQGSLYYTMAGPCTEMCFLENAAQAIVDSVTGREIIESSASARGVELDKTTGMEPRFAAKAAQAASGLSPYEANDILDELILCYEPLFASASPGKTFQECYDLVTLEPTEEHKSVYTKAVDRVRSIGLDMRY